MGVGLSHEQMREMSRRLYVEVFGRGNVGAADEILAEDCVGHGPGTAPVHGRDGIKQQAALLRGAIPDLYVQLEDQFAAADRVASRWLASGMNTGTLRLPTGEIPATHQPIAFTEIRIDRFDANRIVESWFLPDRLTLWQQLGLVPSPREAR
jgi:predicted ester cyclase